MERKQAEEKSFRVLKWRLHSEHVLHAHREIFIFIKFPYLYGTTKELSSPVFMILHVHLYMYICTRVYLYTSVRVPASTLDKEETKMGGGSENKAGRAYPPLPPSPLSPSFLNSDAMQRTEYKPILKTRIKFLGI